MTIESTVLDIIEGNRSAPLSRSLLRGMSQCYRAGVWLHRLAYEFALPTHHLSIPVISVGNIVAGGTGKTPFVHYLATVLAQDATVAILSRGYKRESKKTVLVTPQTRVEECGDEPYFLAQKLPQVKVIVDSDRVVGGEAAIQLGAQVAILDDGMQYHRLKKDFTIVMMDGADLFGKGFYLPRGLLRDSPKRLQEASHIIVKGSFSEGAFQQVVAQIRAYSLAPITSMELQVKNRDALAGKKVAAFCAIASPKRFAHTLQELGCQVVEMMEKGDHRAFSVEELVSLAQRAQERGAEAVVCSEKDRVKLSSTLSLPLPLIPVEVTLVPRFGQEELNRLIKNIRDCL